MRRLLHRSTLFPYTTLFRSDDELVRVELAVDDRCVDDDIRMAAFEQLHAFGRRDDADHPDGAGAGSLDQVDGGDRKSTRLNSSHLVISYAVFCLKKKKTNLA